MYNSLQGYMRGGAVGVKLLPNDYNSLNLLDDRLSVGIITLSIYWYWLHTDDDTLSTI